MQSKFRTIIVLLITVLLVSGCAPSRNGLYVSTKKIDEKELLKAGFEKTHEQVSYLGDIGVQSTTIDMLNEYNGDVLTNIIVDANYWWLSGIGWGYGGPQYRVTVTADVWRKKSPCDKNTE